jgi:hypothetical protein
VDDRQIDELLTSALGRASGSPEAADLARTDCLDAGTLAAWASGTLDPADSDRVDQHLATCARCQEMAAIFARTGPVHTVVALKRPSPLRWIGPIAGLAAAATLVWAVWLRPRPATVPAPVTTIAQDSPAPSPAPENKVAPAAPPPVAAEEVQSKRARQQPPRQEAPRDAQTGQRSAVGGVSAEPSRPAPVPATGAPPPASIPVPAPAAAPAAPPPAPSQPTFRATAPPPVPPPPAAVGQMQERVMIVDALAAKTQAVIAEFSSAAVDADVAAVPRAAGGAGGGGGRGGRGGGVAVGGAGMATNVTASASPPVRWRILGSGAVERSADGGSTWSAVTIDPPAQITAGVAPSRNVCWLVGKAGVVLRSTDAQRFERVTFPVDADLASIRAASGQLTVTTTDGRTFTTTDDGKTWK